MRLRELGAGAAAAVLLATVLAGCGSSAGSTPATVSTATAETSATPAASAGAGVIAPVMIDFDGGTAQFATVGLGNVVVIDVGGADVTSFTGDVGEPTVATFVPGRVDGGATFNPGIQPLTVGSTTVTITDSETSRFVTLDLTVTP